MNVKRAWLGYLHGNHPTFCEVCVSRPGIAALILLAGCSSLGRDTSPLGVALTERFGTARTQFDTTEQKLTIHLSDPRWLGLDDVVGRTCQPVRVARRARAGTPAPPRYALDHLPAGEPRPAFFEVHFQVERNMFGLTSSTSGIGIHPDSL